MKNLGGNVITAHNLVMYSLLTERIEGVSQLLCMKNLARNVSNKAHNMVMYSLLTERIEGCITTIVYEELGWKCNNGS